MIKHKSVNYIHFASLPSTSTWAKENASVFDPNKLTCITAEEQTGGRGTSSKKWFSPKGLNIYTTLCFTLPKEYPFVHNLGQLLSISCCKCLEKLRFNPSIKWPNDLLMEEKKIGGLLAEVTSSGEKTFVALGLGLNVNMPEDLTKTIDQPATSLLEVSGKTWEIQELLHSIVDTFLDDLNILSSIGFPAFFSYYNDHLAFKDRTIEVKDGTEYLEGICKGTSPEGALLLSLPSGKESRIYTGKIDLISFGPNGRS